MKLEFLAEAIQEFDDAFQWYAERSPTAAAGFAVAIDDALDAVLTSPQRFQKTIADCRYCQLDRYPYLVVFYEATDRIIIVSIAHAKRRPGYWRFRQFKRRGI